MENINTYHPEIIVLAQKRASILRLVVLKQVCRTPSPLWRSQQEPEAWSFWIHTSNSPLKLSQKLFIYMAARQQSTILSKQLSFIKKTLSLFQVCSSRLSSSKKHLSGQASEESLRSNSRKASGTSHPGRWAASSSERVGAIQLQALLLEPLWDSTGLKKAEALYTDFQTRK